MKSRVVWLDFLRVLAIFLMVLLHVSAGYMPVWFEQSSFSWWSASVLASLSRVCVPWLIMVSGALLIPQVENMSLMQFYQRRFWRLIKPWAFWSVVFGVVNLLTGNEVSSVKRLLVGTVWTGFWLLPVFVGMYAVAPLWAKVSKSVSVWMRSILIFVGLVILLSGVHLPLYFEYFVLFVLGDILAKLPIKFAWQKLSLVFWLAGLVATVLLTGKLSIGNNGFVSTYYQYHAWTVVLMAVSGFTFFAQTKDFWQKVLDQKIKRMLGELSQLSFQLYFVHLLFFRFGINWVSLPSWLFIPLYTTLIFGGSWASILLLSQNKILVKLSGAEERT